MPISPQELDDPANLLTSIQNQAIANASNYIDDYLRSQVVTYPSLRQFTLNITDIEDHSMEMNALMLSTLKKTYQSVGWRVKLTDDRSIGLFFTFTDPYKPDPLAIKTEPQI